jgi:hypothetical protein
MKNQKAERLEIGLVARRFEQFAQECYARSPLYERLSRRIAVDPEMLSLAARAREGQPVPNLFFAAAHFLLLKGARHPVSAFYPSLSGSAIPADDPYPSFRPFCWEHQNEIGELVSTRLVQTNEVRRCACLMPAFCLISRLTGGRPLSLVEIGASAGLNLLWNHYGYDYGGGHRYGDESSPVQLSCVCRGDRRPPIPREFPAVAARMGVDLNPLDLSDRDALLWLRALVWPEQTERATLLQRAIQIAQRNPPPLVAGDALDLLPDILAAMPQGTAVCVFHSFTLNQMAPAAREALSALIAGYAARRELFRVSIERPAADGRWLALESYTGGRSTEQHPALCHDHGEWIEWIDANSP